MEWCVGEGRKEQGGWSVRGGRKGVGEDLAAFTYRGAVESEGGVMLDRRAPLVLLKGTVTALHGFRPVVRKKFCPDLCCCVVCVLAIRGRGGKQPRAGMPSLMMRMTFG